MGLQEARFPPSQLELAGPFSRRWLIGDHSKDVQHKEGKDTAVSENH